MSNEKPEDVVSKAVEDMARIGGEHFRWNEEDLLASIAKMVGQSVEDVKRHRHLLMPPSAFGDTASQAPASADVTEKVPTTSEEAPTPLPKGFLEDVLQRLHYARTSMRYYSSETDEYADSQTMAQIAAARLVTMLGHDAEALIPAAFKWQASPKGYDFRTDIIDICAVLVIACDAFDTEVAQQREQFEALIAKGENGPAGAWKHRVDITTEVHKSVFVAWLRDNIGAVGNDYMLFSGRTSRSFTVMVKDERKAGLIALRWGDEEWTVSKADAREAVVQYGVKSN